MHHIIPLPKLIIGYNEITHTKTRQQTRHPKLKVLDDKMKGLSVYETDEEPANLGHTCCCRDKACLVSTGDENQTQAMHALCANPVVFQGATRCKTAGNYTDAV